MLKTISSFDVSGQNSIPEIHTEEESRHECPAIDTNVIGRDPARPISQRVKRPMNVTLNLRCEPQFDVFAGDERLLVSSISTLRSI